MATDEKGEKLYNYLEPYERDRFAESKMLPSIVFDWSRVSDLQTVEIDEQWFGSDLCKSALDRGYRCMRVVVDCPNPRHGRFKQVMSDPPGPRDYKCYHCITEEMNRVLSLRMKRDREQAIQ